jgi:eukaryotic-like serine/threonine-protein kinase
MEPPSQKLTETLKTLNLCTQADLRKCRSQVRSLARDLPAFDSVWIDALKQIKAITPFQAKILESSEPQKLKLAAYTLISELGKGSSSTTYLCRKGTSSEKLVLKQIQVHAEDLQPAFERLNSEIIRLKNFQHSSIVQPAHVETDSGYLLTVSRYVSGLNLMELIIRRGRIDPDIVEQITIQLLDALAMLEAAGGIHGDIRLGNIKLTDSGTLVLVDACINPMIFPSLIINGRCDPEQYDGISPERIGTSQMPTVSSDMFSLGVLLWHLLAGRSPYPVGDPIAKLALFQTKRIEDIREWVPDCSPRLAELIHQLTEPDSANRPESFKSIRKNWKGSCRTSCKRLARFRESFNRTVSYQSRNSSLSGKKRIGIFVPLLLAVFLSASVILLDQWGFKGELLNISSTIQKFGDNKTASKKEIPVQGESNSDKQEQKNPESLATNIQKPRLASKKQSTHFHPIPSVNNKGVLELKGETYQARNLSVVGDLVIRGTDSKPAVLMLPPEGISIGARVLTLQNVLFQFSGNKQFSENQKVRVSESSDKLNSILRFNCQRLEITNSRFDFRTGPLQNLKNSHLISWKPLDAVNHHGMIIRMQNTVFFGAGTLFYLNQAPSQFNAENCLALGTEAFVSMPMDGKNHKSLVSFHNTTWRNCESALQFRLEKENSASVSKSIVIDMQNSVFDPAGEKSSLVQMKSVKNPERFLKGIEIIGEGNLIPPELPVISWRKTTQGTVVPLNDQDLTIEGLSIASFEFLGDPTTEIKNSVVTEFNAPRLSDKLPGFQILQSQVIQSQVD